jgi:MFS family permease
MIFRRPQYLISFAFFNSMVQGILLVVLTLIAKERLEASPSWLGYYGFINGALYIVCAWASGRLSDRYGRGRTLAWGLVLLEMGCLLAIFGQHLWFFLVPFGLCGLSMGAIWPAVESGLGDGQSAAQTKIAFGVFNYSWLSAMVIGPVLGGLLYQKDPRVPIYVTMGVTAVFLGLLYLPRTMEIAPWGRGGGFDHDERIPLEKRALFIRLAFVGNITAYVFIASYRSLLPAYTSTVGISAWRYGLLLSAVYGGMFLGNAILMLWHRWHYSLRFLIFVEIGAAILLVLFVLTDSYPALVVIAVLLGFPPGLTYFSSIYYGMAQRERKGAHSGNHEAFIGLGSAMGPILGGWVIANTGAPRGNLVFCAAVWIVAIALQIVLVRRVRPVSGG